MIGGRRAGESGSTVLQKFGRPRYLVTTRLLPATGRHSHKPDDWEAGAAHESDGSTSVHPTGTADDDEARAGGS